MFVLYVTANTIRFGVKTFIKRLPRGPKGEEERQCERRKKKSQGKKKRGRD